MIQRIFLYLVLVTAILSVPVFQAAHALTHVSDIATINPAQVDGNHDQEDTDFDQICLDCLALTAFSIIFSILAAFSVNLIMQGRLSELKHKYIHHHFFSIYLTRAPPLV